MGNEDLTLQLPMHLRRQRNNRALTLSAQERSTVRPLRRRKVYRRERSGVYLAAWCVSARYTRGCRPQQRSALREFTREESIALERSPETRAAVE